MPRAPRTISPNRLAVELAATLSPTIAAPVAALCLDFKCRPAALKQAARELTDNGVPRSLDGRRLDCRSSNVAGMSAVGPAGLAGTS